MELAFETIKFFMNPKGVKGLLLKYFSFEISHEKLEEIGPYKVEEGKLYFEAHEKKRQRALHTLSEALRNLTCTITGNPSTYIDRYSGVPLIGALEFGIIDRGTNLIEIRPCSGCNLACIYCSVHEGPGGTKKHEFIIEKEYLVEEFKKVLAIKEHPVEVFIETQGEPLLYADLTSLIKDLKSLKKVHQVTMVTNGTILTEQRIIELGQAGLDRINWSINSLQPERARTIAGANYNVERIKKLIETAKDHIDILLCPVILKGINDDELEAFVEFAQKIRNKEPIIGFQNFLYYKGGRNPVEEKPLDEFTKEIKELEKKYGTRLSLSAEDFTIEYDNTLKKPFKKKQTITVEKLFKGRTRSETMCKSEGRIVKVIGKTPDKKTFKAQLIRDKHNIFTAKAV